jgi:hypothetical protein
MKSSTKFVTNDVLVAFSWVGITSSCEMYIKDYNTDSEGGSGQYNQGTQVLKFSETRQPSPINTHCIR